MYHIYYIIFIASVSVGLHHRDSPRFSSDGDQNHEHWIQGTYRQTLLRFTADWISTSFML